MTGCKGVFTFANEWDCYNDEVGPTIKGIATITTTGATGCKGWGFTTQEKGEERGGRFESLLLIFLTKLTFVN